MIKTRVALWLLHFCLYGMLVVYVIANAPIPEVAPKYSAMRGPDDKSPEYAREMQIIRRDAAIDKTLSLYGMWLMALSGIALIQGGLNTVTLWELRKRIK